jgi:hypothetical protein|tara:strand:- start:5 stop:226 length:222 start_codon:yes stop_codon:yes gene_type:complete
MHYRTTSVNTQDHAAICVFLRRNSKNVYDVTSLFTGPVDLMKQRKRVAIAQKSIHLGLFIKEIGDILGIFRFF